MKPKRIALIIDEWDCLERCICPVCGGQYWLLTDTQEYHDYTTYGPIVGKYPGWDDAPEIMCEDCTAIVEIFYGQEKVVEMMKSGSLEELEDMALVCMSGGIT